MSAVNLLIKVFVTGCVCTKIVALAKYEYPKNWNNWIMFPAKTTNSLTRSYGKNTAYHSTSIPVYYSATLQDKTENISEPFMISIQSGRSIDDVSEKQNKDLMIKLKEKQMTELSETKSLGNYWYDPMTKFMNLLENYIFAENELQEEQQNQAMSKRYKTKGYKVQKKFKNFMLPLLLAYKLKFFTLIPVLISGLILLVGSTGMAGFFFALFAAVMSLKSNHKS